MFNYRDALNERAGSDMLCSVVPTDYNTNGVQTLLVTPW